MTNTELLKQALEDSNEILFTITGEGMYQAQAQIVDNDKAIAVLSQPEEPAQSQDGLPPLLESSQEYDDFNTFYDSMANLPITIHQIAKRCWNRAYELGRASIAQKETGKPEVVAWAVGFDDPANRSWTNGKPTQETIDYWKSRGIEILYASLNAAEHECPHGVDDGACKQCYSYAAEPVNQPREAKGM